VPVEYRTSEYEEFWKSVRDRAEAEPDRLVEPWDILRCLFAHMTVVRKLLQSMDQEKNDKEKFE
jgi:hypothetical protein